MECWGTQNFINCQLGDKRLNKRALKIGKALGDRFGQPLSMVFPEEKLLKRTYEFFANPQTKFNKITQPHHQKTSLEAVNMPVVLAIGDTTYLDYKNIKVKRDGYGHIGNGGNGLILHSTLAVEPLQGQPCLVIVAKIMASGAQSSCAQKRNFPAEKRADSATEKRK